MTNTTNSLSDITIKATYKYDYGTRYGFHCGECKYDSGELLRPIENCPKCNPIGREKGESVYDYLKRICDSVGFDPKKYLQKPVAPEQFYEECVMAAIRPLLSNIALPYDNFAGLSVKETTLREVARAALEAIGKAKS